MKNQKASKIALIVAGIAILVYINVKERQKSSFLKFKPGNH